MSKEFWENARVMGDYVQRPKRLQPPSPTQMALAMRAIETKATALGVELDALLEIVEDFVLAHGPHWHKGEVGAVWTAKMEQLRAWRDFTQEMGADGLGSSDGSVRSVGGTT